MLASGCYPWSVGFHCRQQWHCHQVWGKDGGGWETFPFPECISSPQEGPLLNLASGCRSDGWTLCLIPHPTTLFESAQASSIISTALLPTRLLFLSLSLLFFRATKYKKSVQTSVLQKKSDSCVDRKRIFLLGMQNQLTMEIYCMTILTTIQSWSKCFRFTLMGISDRGHWPTVPGS